MNIIDVILVIVIGFSIYTGWRKGFIEAALELSIWLGSFLLAFFISVFIVRMFETVSLTAIWIRPVAFIGLLIFFSQFITRTGEGLAKRVEDEWYDHWGNNVLGMVPGMVSGIVYASLLSFFTLSYPLGNLSQRTKDSALANLLNHKNGWPGMLLSEMAADIGYRSPENFTIHTRGAELVSLPFRTKEFRPRPDLEKRMLDMINRERSKINLKPMKFDSKLAQAATKHSSDMLQRGYFSHYTPEGTGPFDRLRSERIRFRIAGENLALAQTLQSAHQGLMESPVHKANILHKSFGRVGIGILDAGANGIIITQNFRN